MKNTARRVLEKNLTISNKKGLHARAAAKFVKVANEFNSEIQVTKESETVSGKSIMGLLMLAAIKHSKIRITARGSDAVAALENIATLVENKFYEE